MDYIKHYNVLIESRKKLNNTRTQLKQNGHYFETHHIIPRCLGGKDSEENLVILTGREHYIAHLLLWKIHGGTLFYAVWLMTHPKTTSGVGAIITSRRYELLREQQRNNNRKYGKAHWNHGKQHTDEAKQKMRRKKLGKTSPRKGIKLTNNTKEKIRVANIGKTLTQEHKNKIATGMRNSGHPTNHCVQPFQHIKLYNNTALKQNWLNADKIYDVWINNNAIGATMLEKLTGIYKYQLRTMIKWFISYGPPSSNGLWIEWKNKEGTKP